MLSHGIQGGVVGILNIQIASQTIAIYDIDIQMLYLEDHPNVAKYIIYSHTVHSCYGLGLWTTGKPFHVSKWNKDSGRVSVNSSNRSYDRS